MANKRCQAFLELKVLIELGNLLDFKFEFNNPHIRKSFKEALEEELCHKIEYIADEACLSELDVKECTCPPKNTKYFDDLAKL